MGSMRRDAACVSLVRELSHAPPMRLRSRDPIGCSRAVVSAMGTSRFDARVRPRCARVDSRISLRETFNQLGQAGDRGKRKRAIFPLVGRLSKISPNNCRLYELPRYGVDSLFS